MTPNGIANPVGALKPDFFAMDSSLPDEEAFEPATSALPPISITGVTLVTAELKDATSFFFPFLLLVVVVVPLVTPSFLPEEPTFFNSHSLTLVNLLSPVASTTNFAGLPSPAAAFNSSKSGRSVVQQKTAPSCRALRARWLRTGRSRATTTPRHKAGSSSSPPASLQNTIAPSSGSFLFQTSFKLLQCRVFPMTVPAEIATQSGRLAARFDCCNTIWMNFDTWKRMEVLISASTKTETAC
mmetsp:Transcript_21746/g.47356  ORF Transcript_21746/g.47356 Transcript_21746/m.47356 type:complete len:241 (+) Transcript_21746:1118-1840(+)